VLTVLYFGAYGRLGDRLTDLYCVWDDVRNTPVKVKYELIHRVTFSRVLLRSKFFIKIMRLNRKLFKGKKQRAFVNLLE
jgi:hypothetical protein